ncbi:MAG: hypothetical protein Q6373_019845 [Candidatus Sigynarchaeota archaeon]
MVNFPNIDKQQDMLLSMLVNQVLKTKLLAKAIAYHDTGLTFAQFAAMADVKSACYLNPGATIEIDALFLDESGHVRIARWGELKDMDIATFLATRRGYRFVFQDSDPTTRTCPDNVHAGLLCFKQITKDGAGIWIASKEIYEKVSRVDKSADSFACPVCGAVFNTYGQFETHVGMPMLRAIYEKESESILFQRLEHSQSPHVILDKAGWAVRMGIPETLNGEPNPMYAAITHAKDMPWKLWKMSRSELSAFLSVKKNRAYFDKFLKAGYGEWQITSELAR